ncbi:MAG: threonine aldolase family protein, partial [Defluviitaleaceae bacterium]|nr:threonine aldolase family protein [Defluviitaleaceae bacterium]
MKIIDLRSDTVTKPTEEMRHAMANAVVGDDVYGDDETVMELERLAAEICGKEAALFTPSGTMANQIAIMTFTKRGDEIILGRKSHIAAYEAGAAAVLSGVNYSIVDNADEIITPADIAERVRGKDVHFPDTGLLCLENALSSGRVMGVDQMKSAHQEAKKHGLPVYLDAARLFNAAVSLGVEPKEIAQYCDALMFCVSKGLCAPVGSLLVGSGEFIERARRYRKMLGGGMRQAGVLASAG